MPSWRPGMRLAVDEWRRHRLGVVERAVAEALGQVQPHLAVAQVGRRAQAAEAALPRWPRRVRPPVRRTARPSPPLLPLLRSPSGTSFFRASSCSPSSRSNLVNLDPTAPPGTPTAPRADPHNGPVTSDDTTRRPDRRGPVRRRRPAVRRRQDPGRARRQPRCSTTSSTACRPSGRSSASASPGRPRRDRHVVPRGPARAAARSPRSRPPCPSSTVRVVVLLGGDMPYAAGPAPGLVATLERRPGARRGGRPRRRRAAATAARGIPDRGAARRGPGAGGGHPADAAARPAAHPRGAVAETPRSTSTPPRTSTGARHRLDP